MFIKIIYFCRSSEEVLHIIQCLIGSLQRARTALVLPKKKAIDELMKSRNMVYYIVSLVAQSSTKPVTLYNIFFNCICIYVVIYAFFKYYLSHIYFQKALSPNLPEDLAISFYIQSHKLIFVAYQLSSVHGTMRIDSCQADCAVPWLSDVLFMLTAALHMCQQLKDKVRPCFL